MVHHQRRRGVPLLGHLPRDRRQRRGRLLTRTPVRILVGAAALGLPLATVALLDPNVEGHYPTCPVRGVLGVDCPGCGSLRALHDLVHGDVVGALDHNALMVLVLPLLALELGRWVASRPMGWWVRHRYAPVAVLVVLTGWVLMRNVSMFPMGVLGSGAWA